MHTGSVGTGTDFHTGTRHFGKLGTTSIPVPDTSVSSVRHQHRHRKLINIGTSIPVTPVLVSLPVPAPVQARYRHRTLSVTFGTSTRHRTLREVRYDINTGTRHFGKFGMICIPVPPVAVWTSVPVPVPVWTSAKVPVPVQHRYRYRTLGQVLYNINPARDTSVTSVRHQYRYQTLRLWYNMHTGTAGTGTDFPAGTGHFGKFGTTPIPVPDTSVSLVHRQYRYRTLR